MNQPDETFRDEGEELIEEIREVRRRISARFDHDPDRLVAYYIDRQERHRDRLLRSESNPEPPGNPRRLSYPTATGASAYTNSTGLSISGERLLWTGQVSAAFSSFFLCSGLRPAGI